MRLGNLPAFFWVIALAVVYLSLGLVVGYFMGYRDGVDDYRSILDQATPK